MSSISIYKFIIIFTVICISFITNAAVKGYQDIVVICSENGNFNKKVRNNLKSIFNTAKLNCMYIAPESKELQGKLETMNKEEDLLIIALEDPGEINFLQSVINYIQSGGKIVIAALTAPDKDILKISGVKNIIKSTSVSGFDFSFDIFPGLKISPADSMAFNLACYEVNLLPGTKVIMRSKDGKPLAWKYKYGKGECLTINSELVEDYSLACLLPNLAGTMNDYFVSTVFNAKVVFIDDFPAPIPSGSEYSIALEYNGRSYQEFYRDIWWPDMKRLARKTGIKYTCLVLGNYDNSVEMPPKPLRKEVIQYMRYFAKSIFDNKDELGIHGYNHASLLTGKYKKEMNEIGYTPWKSVDNMKSSLSMLKQTLDREIGKQEYFTYVPPMNMLSTAGKQAILEVFPTIRCIAGLGDPFADEPGTLHQNIGPDPDFPHVYDLPRFSSGELYKIDEMYFTKGYVSAFGIFSHFFHPDDLLDPERCDNKTWKELYASVGKIFNDISDSFPFLRGMTAREFVEEQFRVMNTKVYSRREGDSILIEYVGGPGPLYHYLRLNDGSKVGAVTNGRFEQIKGASNLYLIEGRSSPVRIKLEPVKK